MKRKTTVEAGKRYKVFQREDGLYIIAEHWIGRAIVNSKAAKFYSRENCENYLRAKKAIITDDYATRQTTNSWRYRN